MFMSIVFCLVDSLVDKIVHLILSFPFLHLDKYIIYKYITYKGFYSDFLMARLWDGGAKPVLYSLRVLYYFRSSLSTLRFIQATFTFVCLSPLGNFKACGNL